MTTFTVWRYEDPEGAQRAFTALKGAASDGLIRVVDHAIVSWPEGAQRPTTHHGNEDKHRGAGWGAFWGVLLGGLFFVPLLGAAAGAGIGALAKATAAVGIDEEQLETIRRGITPGTSALFLVTEEADLDRVGERFHGGRGALVATNLTDAERSVLVETFGG